MGKSKYEKVFPRLKPLPVEDMEYQAMVDVVKQSILENSDPTTPSDELIHEVINESLETIADEVKILCQLLTNAAQKRRHASVYGRYWLELRRIEDHLESQLKPVRMLLEAYHQLGVQQFEVEALDILKFDELGRIRTQPEVVIKVYDRDKFRDWCMAQQLYRELNMHHGTATSITKTLLLQGQEEPEGIKAFINTKFSK